MYITIKKTLIFIKVNGEKSVKYEQRRKIREFLYHVQTNFHHYM